MAVPPVISIAPAACLEHGRSRFKNDECSPLCQRGMLRDDPSLYKKVELFRFEYQLIRLRDRRNGRVLVVDGVPLAPARFE